MFFEQFLFNSQRFQLMFLSFIMFSLAKITAKSLYNIIFTYKLFELEIMTYIYSFPT